MDRPIIDRIIQIFEEIAEAPYAGESLSGNMSHLKKHRFSYLGIDYRIVYQIFEDHVKVEIVHLGTRENFYKELKRRL